METCKSLKKLSAARIAQLLESGQMDPKCLSLLSPSAREQVEKINRKKLNKLTSTFLYPESKIIQETIATMIPRSTLRRSPPQTCKELIPKLVWLYDHATNGSLMTMHPLENGRVGISLSIVSGVVGIKTALDKIFNGPFEYIGNNTFRSTQRARPGSFPTHITITRGLVSCDGENYARIGDSLHKVDDFLFSLLMDYPNKTAEDFRGSEHHLLD
jgi:hypothetical protein